MKLSEHFDSSEFMCPCGCGSAAVNPALVAALEQLRARIGGRPITVNSGVRCAAHNAAVGGERFSQHLFGRAADISVVGLLGEDLYHSAKSLPNLYGFGVAHGWIHLDTRPSMIVARWRYDSKGQIEPWDTEAEKAAQK